VPRVAAARRHDLSDAQWAGLEPVLPAPSGCGRPPKWTKRQIIDGIRWRVRTGTPWRDVPQVYPPWQTLYRWFRRWQREGTWAKVLAGLQAVADAPGRIDWRVSVDSTVSRAHQHAAGARRDGDGQKEPPGGVFAEPADHGLGRSRGGFTTKVHLSCEQGRKILSVVITAGQWGDSPQFVTVLERISVARVGPGRPGPARTWSWPIRPTPAGATVGTPDAVGSGCVSRARPTRTRTARPKGPEAADRRRTTRRSTGYATPAR
jgi:transposase